MKESYVEPMLEVVLFEEEALTENTGFSGKDETGSEVVIPGSGIPGIGGN